MEETYSGESLTGVAAQRAESLASLVHDLRSSIQGLGLAAEVLAQLAERPEVSERVLKMMEAVAREREKCYRLVNQLAQRAENP